MNTKLNKDTDKTLNLHEQLKSITNGKLELNSETLMDIGILLQHLGCELAILSRSEQHKKAQESAKVSESSVSKSPSDFGRKYKEHFGIKPYADPKQYIREYMYYYRHGFCRWELSNISKK